MVIIRFPYQPIRGSWQPIIPIGINLENKWQRIDAYVDSGATYTVLKARIADRLEFNYRCQNRISLQVGDGSLIRVYLHDLQIQVGTERFRCPIGFSDNLGVPFNILGKVGIFEQFEICFKQKERLILFNKNT